MKLKLCILTLVGLVASGLATFAQTSTPAGEPSAATSVTTTNDAAQPDAAADATAPAAEASATNSASAKDPTLVAANTATPSAPAGDTNAAAAAAPATNTPAADAAAAAPGAPAAAAAATPATPQPGAVIPLIVMDDVPLTDAIKNLARQAGLNYMLDPKVSFGQPGPNGQPTPQPAVSIRWENVTAEQALSALLGTYNLQLVEDPKSKIARVTVRDPAAPDPLVTKVIQLKFASPTNLVGAIQNVLTDHRSKVVPDVRTSQLVILATEKEMLDVDKLVEMLDTKTKQVLIEARLLETQINPHSDKGVDWTGTLKNQHFAFGNTFNTIIPPGGILGMNPSGPGSFFNPSTFFLNADGVQAALSFLNTYTETKVISVPRTVTLDNQLAFIEVGEMFPIVNVTAGTANTTGGSQVTYSNLTVRLEVTPRISANDYVHLSVTPRILRLGVPVSSVVGGVNNQVDTFLTRQMQTAVLIPSGNTLVMGGLIDDNEQISNIKVPVLGDIPGLGLLFRHDSKDRVRDNLIVFITPTIVQDGDYQPTATDFLKTPVPAKDSVGKDWSWWDSGKPKDWGKPQADANAKYTTTGQYSDVPPPSKN